MHSSLTQLRTTALTAIADATTAEALRQTEVDYLGRKGELTALLRGVKDLSPEGKITIGKLSNDIKQELEQAIADKATTLTQAHYARLADTEWQDPTYPGTQITRGRLHPITQFFRQAERVFSGMGFSVASGPEVEDIWHNFDAVNIPHDHPARDTQDTLYIAGNPNLALRVHTSTVQARYGSTHTPPFRIVAPGRVFRKDDFDASHSPAFHQMEGLMVDRDLSIANMKAIIEEALRELIDKNLAFRWRTSYFPFVEPGLEVDISCTVCAGNGCSACKHTGWVEVLGCGMVHPNVLQNLKIDPKVWSGFAFGFGIDRMVMMRHRIHDIRLLYENDIRFLKQF